MVNTLKHKIAKDLINKILNGEIKEGENLPGEMELLKIYNTSRPTIRDAIKILSTRGIIHAKQRTGTKVLSINGWNFLDPVLLSFITSSEYRSKITRHFSQVRMFIEGEVSYLAALNISEQGKKLLFEAFNDLIKNAENFNHNDWVQADLKFHKLIYNNCGNIIYSNLANIFSHIWEDELLIASEDNQTDLEIHHKIYYAITQGNAEEARKWTNELTAISAKKMPPKKSSL